MKVPEAAHVLKHAHSRRRASVGYWRSRILGCESIASRPPPSDPPPTSTNAGRPPLPDDALDWLLPAGRPRVVDLGAGTGKLTRQIHARGLDGHRGRPVRRHARPAPRLGARRAGAAGHGRGHPAAGRLAPTWCCVAQAWHWVDPARAVPEVARVLSPGGRLGLIWNLRDERVDWVRRLGEIIGSPESDRGTTDRPAVRPGGDRPVRLDRRRSARTACSTWWPPAARHPAAPRTSAPRC